MAGQKSLGALKAEEKKKRCPECNGELEFDGEEVVCKKCGLVVD